MDTKVYNKNGMKEHYTEIRINVLQDQLNRAEQLVEELNLSGLNKKQVKLIKKYYQNKGKYLNSEEESYNTNNGGLE